MRPLLVAWLSTSLFLGHAVAAFTDPVPIDRVPGEGVAGTVVVDDGDPAVSRTPPAQPRKIQEPPENDPTYGGTGLSLNGYNQVGDGQTRITITPRLPAGRYAVWVRFVRMARNDHGNAESVPVEVHARDGTWEYRCNPRQGG